MSGAAARTFLSCMIIFCDKMGEKIWEDALRFITAQLSLPPSPGTAHHAPQRAVSAHIPKAVSQSASGRRRRYS